MPTQSASQALAGSRPFPLHDEVLATSAAQKESDNCIQRVLVPLETVVITDELMRRRPRDADYEAENRVLAALMEDLAGSSGAVLHRLAASALSLCRGQSAGVSILEQEQGQVFFRWHAVAGAWAGHLGASMPRQGSPCGTVLDRGGSLLLAYPERHYSFPPGMEPEIAEALLVPFHANEKTVGTIWVIAHDDNRQFDREDERVMKSLARFASAAYQVRTAVESNQRKLNAARKLQQISTQLIQEGDIHGLYHKILNAAVDIMRSDMASMQLVDEQEDALRLLASRGFDEDFGRVFEWVRPQTKTSCSLARRRGQRVIVADTETCGFLQGTPDLDNHRRAGIRALQSTPLIARGGRLLGMISTHWRQPHEPTERDLELLDVLARQAADLIEHRQTEDALRLADRQKNEFLATLAHELRNPLAPIRNSLHILKLGGDGAATARVHEMIERQVNHLVRLVDDLLELARITSGKIELRNEPVDVADVIRAAVESSRPLVDAAGHALSITLPDKRLTVNADPVRLAQIVSNLLNNAAKYTDPGGQISLAAREESGRAAISVRDNGIGISAAMLPKLFQMFAQEDAGLARTQGGLGIGLALVKRLVDMHDGSIMAHSGGHGQGSEFTVRLPLVEAQVMSAARHAARTQGQVGGLPPCRILVADDNKDSADTLAMILQLTGHEVHAVYDGQQAVTAAQAHRPDVVLLDLGMPKLDGCDAARQIRELPGGDRVTLIALTGWGKEEDRRRTEEAGFSHHLVKPVDPAALTELLQSLRQPAAR